MAGLQYIMPDLNPYILSILIFFPLAGALLVALLPSALSRTAALAVAALNFVFSLHLVQNWDFNAGGYQFEKSVLWIPKFGINYHLGADGLSILMILLTTFLMPIAILASWESVEKAWQSVFCVPAFAGSGLMRRVLRLRFDSVLHFLRSGAGADVFNHWHLGR